MVVSWRKSLRGGAWRGACVCDRPAGTRKLALHRRPAESGPSKRPWRATGLQPAGIPARPEEGLWASAPPGVKRASRTVGSPTASQEGPHRVGRDGRGRTSPRHRELLSDTATPCKNCGWRPETACALIAGQARLPRSQQDRQPRYLRTPASPTAAPSSPLRLLWHAPSSSRRA